MEKLTELLTMLASKLGTTVEYLWTVLIKQATISGIQNIILSVVVTIPIIIFGVYLRYFIKNKEKIEDGYNEEFYYVGLVVGTIISVVCVLVFAECINTAMTAFINPEFWALKEILEQLKTN